MASERDELIHILMVFSESGWDLIGSPAKEWLDARGDREKIKAIVPGLIAAIEKASMECGNCGCEFDPLYEKFLGMKEELVR